TIDWPLALAVTAAAVVGSVIGGRWVARIPQARLRRGFGWFVAAMSIVVLVQEAPAGVRDAVLGSPFTWVAAGVLAVALVAWWRGRRQDDAPGAGEADAPGAVDADAPVGARTS